MSKPDDTVSPDTAASATPVPVPVGSVDGYPVERSGSISISSTDFSTPMVRKRTITRPRGLPTAAAAEGPPVIDEADIPTPPPRTNGAPITDSQHAAASPGVAPTEPPPGDDQREAHPTEGSLHDQASRLREAELLLNEADQVTPPPAPDKGGPKVASAAAVPVAVDEPDPGPTPPPEPVVAAPPPAPEEEAAMEATPPPVAAAGTPESEVDGVVVAIPDVALQEPELDSDRDPSLPTPVTLAEAEHQPASDGEPEDLGSEAEDIDLSDAPLDASPVAPIAIARPPTPPAIPPTASPPPIPGSVLKTPRPEVRRPEVKAEDAGDPPTGLPVFPIVPEALAQRPRRPKRSKPWFEEVFDEDYLRTLPFMTSEQTLREVSFIEESLRAAPAAEILDIGCGYGRHAIELVQRGLNVTGLDLSLPLLLRAAEEAQKRALSVNFVHADMREMPFDQKFDGAYCMLTSFGYFDEEANLRVAEGVARALKPGGRFLLDIVNRDYIVNDLPARIWWEGVGCVVLEEVDFNFHTSRVVTRRSIVFEDGRQLEHEISVRAYSLHELGRLLRQAGFRVLDISGSMAARGRFFGGTSRNLLILSEKRSE